MIIVELFFDFLNEIKEIVSRVLFQKKPPYTDDIFYHISVPEKIILVDEIGPLFVPVYENHNIKKLNKNTISYIECIKCNTKYPKNIFHCDLCCCNSTTVNKKCLLRDTRKKKHM